LCGLGLQDLDPLLLDNDQTQHVGPPAVHDRQHLDAANGRRHIALGRQHRQRELPARMYVQVSGIGAELGA
jgi:hypothetical protein